MARIFMIILAASLLANTFFGMVQLEFSTNDVNVALQNGRSSPLPGPEGSAGLTRATTTVDDDGPADFNNIQDAIDNASNGDTIIVKAGIYNEFITIDRELTLQGDPGDITPGPGPTAPVLDGGGAEGKAIMFEGGVSNITVEGFEFQNYGGDRGCAICAWNDAPNHNIVVQDNYMHNLSYNGILVGNCAGTIFNNWTVRNNVVDHTDGIWAGLELTNVCNSTISNNVIATASHTHPYMGILLQGHTATSADAVVDSVSISDNDITGPFSWGAIYLWAINLNCTGNGEPVGAPILGNISITSNVVTGAERGLKLRKHQGMSGEPLMRDISVMENVLSKGTAGIQFDDTLWFDGNGGGENSNIYISNNEITDNDIGIHICKRSQEEGGITRCDGIFIENNTLDNNTLFGMRNEGTGILNGTNNWWGDDTGPFHSIYNAKGLGDNVCDGVNFHPWNEFAPPISSVLSLSPYWQSGHFNISVNGSDVGTGIFEVELLYRHSPDNITWEPWKPFGGPDALPPYEWNFSVPDGDGIYEFCSKSRDHSGNVEDGPTWGQASVAVDTASPMVVLDNITVDEGTLVLLNGSRCSDPQPGIIANHTWTFEYNDEEITLYGECCDYRFDIPGVYQVTLQIQDMAGHRSSGTLSVNVLDITVPFADAGEDVEVDQFETVSLSARESKDNVGIVDYTWTFIYDNDIITLQGESVNYTFNIPGVYNILLYVEDGSGNGHVDWLTVTVNDIVFPTAIAGLDMEVEVGSAIILDGEACEDDVGIVSYVWTFEYDNSPVVLHGMKAIFTFNISGIYNITLTVWDEAGMWGRDHLLVTVIGMKVTGLSLGPFMWADETSIIGAVLELETGTQTFRTYSAMTDSTGVATFEMPVETGNYVWTLERRLEGMAYTIGEGVIAIDIGTPVNVTWWPEEESILLMSPYTESELDELHDIGVSEPDEPRETTEMTFLEDVPRDVHVGGDVMEVLVTTSTPYRVTIDIDQAKSVEVKLGQMVTIDTDGDGEVDVLMVFNGEDENGNPVVEFHEIDVSTDVRSGDTGNYYVIMIVMILVPALLVMLIIFRSRKRSRSLEKAEEIEIGERKIVVKKFTKKRVKKAVMIKKRKLKSMKKIETASTDTEGDIDIVDVEPGDVGESEPVKVLETLKSSVKDKLRLVLEEGIEKALESINEAVQLNEDVQVEQEFLSMIEGLMNEKKYLEAVGTLKGIEMSLDAKRKKWKRTPYTGKIGGVEERLERFADEKDSRAVRLRERLLSSKMLLEEDNYSEVVRELDLMVLDLEELEAEMKERTPSVVEPERAVVEIGEYAVVVAPDAGAIEEAPTQEQEVPQEHEQDDVAVGIQEEHEDATATDDGVDIEYYCAYCDSGVEEQMEFCPNCGMRSESAEREVDSEPPSGEIPKGSGRYVEPYYDFEILETKCEIEYHCFICDAVIYEDDPSCPNCNIRYDSKDDPKLQKLLLYEVMKGKGRYS